LFVIPHPELVEGGGICFCLLRDDLHHYGKCSNTGPPAASRTRQRIAVGSRLGLDNAWATQVIAAVGDYGQLYDRTLGAQSPLHLPRAQNRLATHGGLQLPLPLK
jgi:hypothetical protein